jgi:hypothetical protein
MPAIHALEALLKGSQVEKSSTLIYIMISEHGLIDYVRLREELNPPHWKRTPGNKWDAGYDKTGYFLDWIEDRYGTGTIQELNASMKDTIYREVVFKDLTGRTVSKLWNIYLGDLDIEDSESKESTPASESWVTIQRDETV